MGVNVRERPAGSGEFWVFINFHGRRTAKKIGPDKRLALRVAEGIRAQLVLGEFNLAPKEAPKAPTFEAMAREAFSLPRSWRESTRELYTLHMENHILPKLGKRPVDELSRKAMKEFFDMLAVSGLSQSVLSTIRVVVNTVFDHAVDREVLTVNPCRDIKLPRQGGKEQAEVDPLDESELALVLDHFASTMEGRYYPLFLCLGRTGMRIGEALALQWDSVDFHGRFLVIKRSYRMGRTTPPKNGKPRRVAMTPELTGVLQGLLTRAKRDALATGSDVGDGLVFHTDDGQHLDRGALLKLFHRALGRLGLRRVRLHDLRHGYATARLARGHNIYDVSKSLGHSDISITTKTYAHWVPSSFQGEVDELDTPLPQPDKQPAATQAQPALVRIK